MRQEYKEVQKEETWTGRGKKREERMRQLEMTYLTFTFHILQ